MNGNCTNSWYLHQLRMKTSHALLIRGLQAVPAPINAPIDVTPDVNTTVSTAVADVLTFRIIKLI